MILEPEILKMKSTKTNFAQYIKTSIRTGGLDIEFDGFVKNIHPSLTLFVKCFIKDDFGGYTKIVKLAPRDEKMVMSHWGGPMFGGNEYAFDVVDISDQEF